MQRHTSLRALSSALAATLAVVLAGPTGAVTPKQPGAYLDAQESFKPDLYISTGHAPLADVLERLPNKPAWDARISRAAAKDEPLVVFVEPRTGVPSNWIMRQPLIPGSGLGNSVTLESLGRALGRQVEQVDAALVADVVRRFVERNRDALGVDTSQLSALKATQVDPDLWQISGTQEVGGIPVRHAVFAASISHGNLVTLGFEAWSDVSARLVPVVPYEKAFEMAFAGIGGRAAVDEILQAPTLVLVPYAPAQYQDGERFAGPVGRGLAHRLAWSLVFSRPPEQARWEVLLDAQTGEQLAFSDTNHYAAQQIKGGVYPLSNTEQCPDFTRCGSMQAGYPMPWANTGLASPNNYTNSAGIFDFTSGTATTSLNGKYFRMSDSCGTASASASGSIDLGGTNGQHDCTTPGSGGAGNTPASRAGFYELNKLGEQARGWLPSNTWLQGQVTSNMNLNQTCNAFWNGSTVNFYRSGGGCRNTGEIAAIFDHEWGHGLDDNDANGSITASGEAYADIASIYRLNASCVGYGFFQTVNNGCGQTADGTGYNTNEALTGASYCATDCSGVRDTDYAKHSPATPATALGFVCTQCTTGSGGVCGRQTHCSAAPVRQMAWDLVKRDLAAAPFSMDDQTALITATRLFYQGSGSIASWHSCTCGSTSTGCGATNGYMAWITADDDNGNLNDGTPHMTAIYNAYNRHGIACSTPTAQNAGCSAGPSTAPTLSATPGNNQVALSWNTISGATRYWVFRGEGHGGCSMGKAKIAEVTGTTYTDTQVANGRPYYYTVVAAGASNACFSRSATCTTVTPVASSDTTPPVTSITAPAAGSTVSGTVSVTASASDNVGVTNVQFYVDGSLAGSDATSPYAYSWNTASVSNGSHTLQSRAYDAAGNVGNSTTISVTVNNTTSDTTPPVTSITAPAAGSTVSGTVSVTASASDNVGVTNVQFYVDGALAGSDATSPYAYSWNTASVSNGSHTLQSRAYDAAGNVGNSTTISVTVNNTTGPPDLTASFDATLQAPKCTALGRSCDTGAALVLGRANLGPEPNQPNTIADSCADGTSGTFHSDESNDRLKVSTTDGSAFAPGKTVRIDATVWAYSSYTTDKLDLYYAANASSPSWTFITTLTPTAAGAQTLSATYTLPSGSSLQAVRAVFRYQGSAGACVSGSYNDRDDLVFAVDAPPPTPDFSVACSPASLSAIQGGSAASTCTVTSTGGFASAVSLACAGLPSGATCSFSPASVTPPANGTVNSSLTVSVASSTTIGAYNFTANGTSGSTTRSANLSLNVTSPVGDVLAAFDTTLQAPKCTAVGRSCDTGAALVLGRSTKGPEPNYPNTINDSCADGTSGTYHVDESNDRLKVSTTDGSALAPGKTVRIDATVWAYSSYTSDKLDLYYAANAASPTWTFIATLTPTAAGAQTLSATYTLPAGTLQAVRAQFRYTGSAGTCTSGGYNDRDDLVFAVNP